MSRASNLAGFVTSISPVSNLNVGVVTASSFVGNLTGNVTGTVTGTAATASFATTSFGLSGNPDITVTQLTATRISAGGTTGTTGQVLQSTGTGVTWATASSGGVTELANVIGYNSAGIRSDTWNNPSGTRGRLEVFGSGNYQVFTSPGTFVVNPGISSIRVRVVGAGGKGGNGGSPGFNPVFRPAPEGGPYTVFPAGGSGSGGGGGGYAHKVITSFSAPRTYTVTVGASPGGTSSFGSEVSATGGNAGNNGNTGTPSPPAGNVPGVSGGVGSGGDVNYVGASSTSVNTAPPVGNPTIGAGAAAASQLGTPSPINSNSIPGLPEFSSNIRFIGPTSEYVAAVIDTGFGMVVNRFPFDVFNGFEGTYYQPSPTISYPSPLSQRAVNGANGGRGSIGAIAAPGSSLHTTPGSGGYGGGGGSGIVQTGSSGTWPGATGGTGGFGGGGGGGGGRSGVTQPPFVNPGPIPAGTGLGGPGGSGIVIVEW